MYGPSRVSTGAVTEIVVGFLLVLRDSASTFTPHSHLFLCNIRRKIDSFRGDLYEV